jgi:hypothetical protein
VVVGRRVNALLRRLPQELNNFETTTLLYFVRGWTLNQLRGQHLVNATFSFYCLDGRWGKAGVSFFYPGASLFMNYTSDYT